MTSKQSQFLPSDNDVAFYRKHGWYISPPVLDERVLETARLGCARYYANDIDHHLPDIAHHFDSNKKHTLRTAAYASLQVNELWNLVSQPVIGAIAARLAGTDCIRLFRDQLIYKPPQAGDADNLVGWHCDRAYWLMCTSEKMLSAWVPLTDCNEQNGTLTVFDGSHRWTNNTAIRGFDRQDMDELEHQFQSSRPKVKKIALEVRAGQVAFHHCLTIHGSQANLSANPRIVLSIHMQDSANRYRRFFNDEGKLLVHLNDFLCSQNNNGEPDYTDPAICPVLFQN
jgi:ectoine hydroxylase-related dioxygenase (phytanoyl-CoA dioxygenase family)